MDLKESKSVYIPFWLRYKTVHVFKVVFLCVKSQYNTVSFSWHVSSPLYIEKILVFMLSNEKRKQRRVVRSDNKACVGHNTRAADGTILPLPALAYKLPGFSAFTRYFQTMYVILFRFIPWGGGGKGVKKIWKLWLNKST